MLKVRVGPPILASTLLRSVYVMPLIMPVRQLQSWNLFADTSGDSSLMGPQNMASFRTSCSAALGLVGFDQFS